MNPEPDIQTPGDNTPSTRLEAMAVKSRSRKRKVLAVAVLSVMLFVIVLALLVGYILPDSDGVFRNPFGLFTTDSADLVSDTDDIDVDEKTDSEPIDLQTADYVWRYGFQGKRNVLAINHHDGGFRETRGTMSYILEKDGSRLVFAQNSQSYLAEGLGFSSQDAVEVTDGVSRVTRDVGSDLETGYYMVKDACGSLEVPCYNFNFVDNAAEGYLTAKLVLRSDLGEDERAEALLLFDSVIANTTILSAGEVN